MTLPNSDHDGLLRQVLAILAERMDRPVADLDPGQSFIELGLDSVEAVFLCGALEEHLNRPIDPVYVFEARSVSGFAQLLLAQVGAAEPRA
jgi:acyl carrier protein